MKQADMIVVIRSLAAKPVPDLTQDGDEEFVPPEELEDVKDKKKPSKKEAAVGWLKKLFEPPKPDHKTQGATQYLDSALYHMHGLRGANLNLDDVEAMNKARNIMAKYMFLKANPDWQAAEPQVEVSPPEQKPKVDRKIAAERACAFDLGLRWALNERGIGPGPRQEIAVKIAFALSEGKIGSPQDVHQVVKKAADDLEEDEGIDIGDWITRETRNLHPVAKLLLLTLGGAGLGAGAGAVTDKVLELMGRKPSHAGTLFGALAGGGLGAYKHVKDITGPIPGAPQSPWSSLRES